jgi:hypothetical protein
MRVDGLFEVPSGTQKNEEIKEEVQNAQSCYPQGIR